MTPNQFFSLQSIYRNFFINNSIYFSVRLVSGKAMYPDFLVGRGIFVFIVAQAVIIENDFEDFLLKIFSSVCYYMCSIVGVSFFR